ncbi:SRPBCC family protein [Marinobacteraceae bacterium S3BR75-40.1]
MAQHKILIEETFPLPVSRVFAVLSDHEQFGRLLRAPVRRTRDSQQGDPNGAGSVRLLGIGPFGIEETVTAFVPDRLIEYSITNGGPIRNHLGRMEFEDLGNNRTRLVYEITFEACVPLLGYAVKPALETAIRQGLKRLPQLA